MHNINKSSAYIGTTSLALNFEGSERCVFRIKMSDHTEKCRREDSDNNFPENPADLYYVNMKTLNV